VTAIRISLASAALLGLAPFALQLAPARGGAPLKNPSFEAGPDGWSVHVYGAPARVEADGRVVREGERSLRISASEPSDAALEQDITLRPGGCYRLTGWVRTRRAAA
jgi:hypothetical protein